MDLGKLNKTFLIIANQIVRLDQSSSSLGDSQMDRYIDRTGQEVEKFGIVRQASRQLHEALSQTCRVHAQHLALLCVQAAFTSSGPDSVRSEIQFKLSFTHKDSVTGLISPLNLSEETTKTMSLSLNQKIDQGNNSSTDGQPCQHTEVPKVSVCNLSWFEVQTILLNQIISSEKVIDQLVSVADLGNQNRNFLGILEETESCKHVIFGPSNPTYRRQTKTSISLTQLIAQQSGGGFLGGMPQFQRLRLAGCLALAVLQYHSTPWLSENWQSENVVFDDVMGQDLEHQSLLPHLYTVIAPGKHKDNSVGEAKVSRTSLSVTSIAPNMLLFKLGIMLLELAYGAPFKTLQKYEDNAAYSENDLNDFVTARRLADGVGTSLGATFATIVKKCLRCDFGCGEDLDDPELQSRLYEDVFCKLKTLEDGFRKLQVGI